MNDQPSKSNIISSTKLSISLPPLMSLYGNIKQLFSKHHPKILFLDEPTLGLDPQTRNHMWEYIKKLNKEENMTVFFTTHYMEEADRVADTIAVIDNGKIIQQGTSKQLKELTKSNTLEEAFLKLTGHSMREEAGTAKDRMRISARTWRL